MSGIVNKHVDAFEAFHGLFDAGRDIRGVAQIQRNRQQPVRLGRKPLQAFSADY